MMRWDPHDAMWEFTLKGTRPSTARVEKKSGAAEDSRENSENMVNQNKGGTAAAAIIASCTQDWAPLCFIGVDVVMLIRVDVGCCLISS